MTSLKDFPDYAKLNSHLTFRNLAEKWFAKIVADLKQERKFLMNDLGQNAELDKVTSAKLKMIKRFLGE